MMNTFLIQCYILVHLQKKLEERAAQVAVQAAERKVKAQKQRLKYAFELIKALNGFRFPNWVRLHEC